MHRLYGFNKTPRGKMAKYKKEAASFETASTMADS